MVNNPVLFIGSVLDFLLPTHQAHYRYLSPADPRFRAIGTEWSD